MCPDEYCNDVRAGRSALALRSEAVAVLDAFFEGRNCVTAADVGRAAVSYFPLKVGEGVVRTYRRGGLVAWVLRDQFLGNRMRQEFDIHLHYFRGGGAVPEPLGVCWERNALVYRGAIATRRLDGETLLQYLLTHSDKDRVLAQAGAVIRHLHDAGIWHGDLQLKNIYIGAQAVWLLDFDGARSYLSLGRVRRSLNLLRLRRSFEKHGFARNDFQTLLQGYGEIALPPWLDGLYRGRSLLRGSHRHD